MCRSIIIVVALCLAACGPEPLSPEQQRIEDDAAIAAVEAAQEIPPEQITPGSISFSDIEAEDLIGAGCAFSPLNGDADRVFLTVGGIGYLKIGGEFQRLAADMGSGALPMEARARYHGLRNSAELSMEESEGKQSGMDSIAYPAFLTIRNARGQSVYSARGRADCGA